METIGTCRIYPNWQTVQCNSK